jgi:hypothetical protein
MFSTLQHDRQLSQGFLKWDKRWDSLKYLIPMVYAFCPTIPPFLLAIFPAGPSRSTFWAGWNGSSILFATIVQHKSFHPAPYLWGWNDVPLYAKGLLTSALQSMTVASVPLCIRSKNGSFRMCLHENLCLPAKNHVFRCLVLILVRYMLAMSWCWAPRNSADPFYYITAVP